MGNIGSKRQNLIRKGVVLESDVCTLCEDLVEEPRHVFFQCSIAQCVIYRICRWWDLDGQNLTSFSDWQTWFLSIRLPSKTKMLLEGVFYVVWWRRETALGRRVLVRRVHGVTSPESTTQTLPSFEEYTPPVTYQKEVEKTLETPIEGSPSFDRPEPQPLLNSPSLDVSLGDVIGPELSIKPHSLDSSRMKVEYLLSVEFYGHDLFLEIDALGVSLRTILLLLKPALVYIDVHTSKETPVRRKDTIGLIRKGKLVVGNNEVVRLELFDHFHRGAIGGHLEPRYKPDLAAYPGLLQPLPTPEKEENITLQEIIVSLKQGLVAKKHYRWVNDRLIRKGKLVVGNNEVVRLELFDHFHRGAIGGHLEPRKQVKHFVKECLVCHRYKPDLAAYPGLLQPLPTPEK
nr:RNA-directed DNA polymerase, eukaryota [Tanacetum cinerariifolium]